MNASRKRSGGRAPIEVAILSISGRQNSCTVLKSQSMQRLMDDAVKPKAATNSGTVAAEEILDEELFYEECVDDDDRGRTRSPGVTEIEDECNNNQTHEPNSMGHEKARLKADLRIEDLIHLKGGNEKKKKLLDNDAISDNCSAQLTARGHADLRTGIDDEVAANRIDKGANHSEASEVHEIIFGGGAREEATHLVDDECIQNLRIDPPPPASPIRRSWKHEAEASDCEQDEAGPSTTDSVITAEQARSSTRPDVKVLDRGDDDSSWGVVGHKIALVQDPCAAASAGEAQADATRDANKYVLLSSGTQRKRRGVPKESAVANGGGSNNGERGEEFDRRSSSASAAVDNENKGGGESKRQADADSKAELKAQSRQSSKQGTRHADATKEQEQARRDSLRGASRGHEQSASADTVQAHAAPHDHVQSAAVKHEHVEQLVEGLPPKPKAMELRADVATFTCRLQMGGRESESLRGVTIGDKEAAAMAHALRDNSHLTTLDLSDSTIHGGAATILSTVLGTPVVPVPNLNRLVFARCPLGDAVATIIWNCLTRLSITYLDMRSTLLSPMSGQSLANTLIACPQCPIQTLNLSGNSLLSTGASYLASALQSSTTLQVLNLDGNGVDDSGALALAQGLKTSHSLLSLHLVGNEITALGGQALAQAASGRAVRMRLIDLTSNKIAAKAVADIEKTGRHIVRVTKVR